MAKTPRSRILYSKGTDKTLPHLVEQRKDYHVTLDFITDKETGAVMPVIDENTIGQDAIQKMYERFPKYFNQRTGDFKEDKYDYVDLILDNAKFLNSMDNNDICKNPFIYLQAKDHSYVMATQVERMKFVYTFIIDAVTGKGKLDDSTGFTAKLDKLADKYNKALEKTYIDGLNVKSTPKLPRNKAVMRNGNNRVIVTKRGA